MLIIIVDCYFISIKLHRIAETVETIHSESARRLQLKSGEESKNQTFLASTLVFTELKVLIQLYFTLTNWFIVLQAKKEYLNRNGLKYSVSSTVQGKVPV